MKDKRQKLTTILKTILNILHSGAVIRVMDIDVLIDEAFKIINAGNVCRAAVCRAARAVKTTTSRTGTKCTGTKCTGTK